MTRITTIINQKGGVGKTTTAHALATGLRAQGKNPLVVDTDPQGNLTYTMGADGQGAGLYEAMREETTAQAVLRRTPQGDLIPSTLLLAGADLEFTQTGREYILRDVLAPLLPAYTRVIIDSPPTLGIMTINALTASTDVIIPMGADIYSLQGLGQLYSTIGKVRKYCNPDLVVAGLVITRYSRRAILTRDLTEAIEDSARRLETPVYKAVIREGIAVREAQTQRASLFESHPDANPTLDYQALVTEYLAQEGETA